ncbi:MAG: YXWGXW repeat-containing protein, partial [Candidatus Eremiobacteraeota bacterium]|nr:YXWGXW repeat-containing protein [Candidatus Eremiobacteraeota bacterium]
MRVLKFVLPIAIVALSMAMPMRSNAQVYISLFAPPMMPDYTQPAVTVPNAIWTPGYWAWGPAGYYWVPGTYVTAPSPGLYWTPGYWGANTGGAGYMWNSGYWGPGVGFYGGVNYGGGYYGNGYVGGTWQGPAFAYNTAVTPVNTSVIRNVYVNKTVVVKNVNRYSYNGPGGIRMQPNAQQLAYAREKREGLTPAQRAHITEASQDRNLYAKVNNGKPPEVAVARPLSTTNRPSDFKPLTAADKAPANQPMAKPNTMTKPAGNASTMHAAPKPEAKPAAKPMAKPAAKPPPEKMKPAPQSKPAAKP